MDSPVILFRLRIGGTIADEVNAIFVYQSRNVYDTGYFTDTVDLDQGIGTCNLISDGQFHDMF